MENKKSGKNEKKRRECVLMIDVTWLPCWISLTCSCQRDVLGSWCLTTFHIVFARELESEKCCCKFVKWILFSLVSLCQFDQVARVPFECRVSNERILFFFVSQSSIIMLVGAIISQVCVLLFFFFSYFLDQNSNFLEIILFDRFEGVDIYLKKKEM